MSLQASPVDRLPVTLTGYRVVITGAASGIGLVVAQSFADAGAQVFISDLSADALADALAANPALRGTVCDVSDTSAIRDMFNAASAELGVVDVLINNAGVAGPIGPIEDLSIAAVESTFAINNVAQFSCAQEAVKLMPASGGAIINLSSVAGRLAFRNRSAYATAKWGVVGFTRSLALELGAKGIRVNAILPGHVNGDRFRTVWSTRAKERGITFEEMKAEVVEFSCLQSTVEMQDIANMALYLASPFGKMITGQALSVCAGVEMMP
ncbi:MAG: 3-oxoacyl-[acyl-carrier-protein] reductase [Confluentimicrobium sp.]|nr:3-oxoacyl-[acyl-carrier-protein] reductase [Actibacterium sp.]|tara:strand:- start:812 stop:1615 length:804 start_codon:yes stop_codon:yes gene_type:complete